MRLAVLIVLVLLVVGALPHWGYSAGWGYRPSSALGVLLLVLVLFLLLGAL